VRSYSTHFNVLIYEKKSNFLKILDRKGPLINKNTSAIARSCNCRIDTRIVDTVYANITIVQFFAHARYLDSILILNLFMVNF